MTEFYDNLLKATSNIDDITTERYATVTKLNGNYCDVKEEDTGLEHTNVPIVNGANLSVGDKAIIGFINNSIYDVVCYGALDKTVHDPTKQDKLISGENIKTINNNSILGSGNLVIEGGGTGVDIVTEWETTTSDSKVASEKLTKDTLDTKVDKENGKGLSSNDFTNNYKSTMDSLKTVATTGSYTDLTDKPSIPSASSSNPSADTSSGAVGTGTTWARADHKHPKSSIYAESSHTHTKSQITDFPTLSTVATTGDYDDLLDKPSIPSSSSDLSDGSDLVKKSNTNGLIKNDGTIDTSAYITSSALSGYQTTSNLVTSFSSTTSDSKYPSEKLVKTELDKKIATSSTTGLVKNDGSIDTSSYITSSAISGKEDTINKVTSWSSTVNDTHYPTEKLVKDSLDSKQATLVSGTNIKTVNNESLLGSGNITIQGGGGSGGGSYLNDFYGDSSTNELVIDYTNTTGSDIVTSWSSTTSDTKVPSEKLTKDTLDTKANSTHTHTYSDLNSVSTVTITVTYSNNTSENITLLKYTGS